MSTESEDLHVVIVDDHASIEKVIRSDLVTGVLLGALAVSPRTIKELEEATARYELQQLTDEEGWKSRNVTKPKDRWLRIDLHLQSVMTNVEDLIPEDGWYRYGDLAEESTFREADELETEGSNETHISMHFPTWWNVVREPVKWKQALAYEPGMNYFFVDDFRSVLTGPSFAQAMAIFVDSTLDSRPELLNALSATYSQKNRVPQADGSFIEPQLDKQVKKDFYTSIVTIHRNWLMIPHPLLASIPPRYFLHCFRNYHDREIEIRQNAFQKNQTQCPVSKESWMYRCGPMGTVEVCNYFDMCREIIQLAMIHRATSFTTRDALQAFIESCVSQWMSGVDQHDSSEKPVPYSEADKDRQMLVLVDDDHMIDCDCPICVLMHQQGDLFGPSITYVTGEHLEYDRDFAFSLSANEDQWQESLEELGLDDDDDFEDDELDEDDDDFEDDELDEDDAEEINGTASESDEDDEDFASPWHFSGADGLDNPLMQDASFKTMMFSFRLSEFLQNLRELDGDNLRVQDVLSALKRLIAATKNSEDLGSDVTEIQSLIEEIGASQPTLIPQSASLQSLLEEIRLAAKA